MRAKFIRMNISIGGDHAGPALKQRIMEHFGAEYTFVNRGTDGPESVDYPDFAHAVSADVEGGEAALGVLICGSANGVAMTANKHKGVRAGIAWTPEIAALARQHNDANVICIPARFVSTEEALEIVDAFLKADFEGGRHARRVAKIPALMLAAWMGVAQLFAQDAAQFAAEVRPADLKAHLEVLASDAYEGRETGTRGAEMAAEYIAAHFASLGLEQYDGQTYFQEVELMKSQAPEAAAQVVFADGTADSLSFLEEFVFYPGLDAPVMQDLPLVFAGYGVQIAGWDDYEGLDVAGQIVVVLDGTPTDRAGDSYFTDPAQEKRWTESSEAKRALAAEFGAAGLVVVRSDYATMRSRMKPWLTRESLSLVREETPESDEQTLPLFYLGEKTLARWFDAAGWKSLAKLRKRATKKGVFERGVLGMWNYQMTAARTPITAHNVLGYLRGSDPDLADELLVITAHYDHVGIIDGQIHNGADDDGSGTVTVLELADAFVQAKAAGMGPRRSILFMTVVGEEKGLLGSEWYTDHPIWPLEQTIANLNVDMIGRVDDAHADDERYVYLIGSDKISTELHQISEDANEEHVGLALDYTFNAPNDPNRFYYRSDHYNFAKNGIPVIFYFSGVHEDYHKPGDDTEKILFDKTAEIGRLIFHTAWELVNRDERIVVDVENDFPADR